MLGRPLYDIDIEGPIPVIKGRPIGIFPVSMDNLKKNS